MTTISKQSGCKTVNLSKGFSAIELLITLFIAAAFLVSGYQLYNLVIKDGGQSRQAARANNAAYDYLQRYKPTVTSTCVAQTPVNNQSDSTVTGLSNVYVTVSITCPFGTTSTVSKVLVTIAYGSPQKTVTSSSYANSTDYTTPVNIVYDGLIFYLDAGKSTSYPGSGTAWNDISVSSYNATLNATGYTYNSSYGGMITFDGTSGYARSSSAGFKPLIGNAYSISVWINDTATESQITTSYDRFVAFANGTTGVQLGLARYNSHNFFYIQEGISSNLNVNQRVADMTYTGWHNIVATRDGASTYNIYLDGTECNYGAYAGNSTPYVTDTGYIYIGQRGNGSYMHGSIPIVMIYNKALSAPEVLQNFNAFRGRYGI